MTEPSHRRARRTASGVIGVDLGATKVVSGWVDRDGTVDGHSGVRFHRNEGYPNLVSEIVRCVRATESTGARSLASVGVGIAAQVDSATGRVLYAPNLGCQSRPLASDLARQLQCPVYLINDARAATLGEWRHGAGRGSDNWFCLMVGTGVGSSAVIGGVLLEGASNSFGEVGHMTLVAGGAPCHCPHRGCIEAYIGGWAIGERARREVVSPEGRKSLILTLAGTPSRVTARTVFEAYRAGDPIAVRLVKATEQYFADAVVGLINGFNPGRLVLGGGIIEGLPHLLPILRKAIRTHCQPSESRVRVVGARLGADTVLIGAGTYALERGESSPVRDRPTLLE
ncbi:MAG: ROK family protein [Thermoplasmata archaeon]